MAMMQIIELSKPLELYPKIYLDHAAWNGDLSKMINLVDGNENIDETQ